MNGPERTATLMTYLSTMQAHLGRHRGLPGPFSVFADVESAVNVTVQLDANRRLSAVAAGLLVWADSLIGATATVWRACEFSVHVSVTGMAGGVSVRVFDVAAYDPGVFGDLPVGARREVTLGRLRAWALGCGAGVVA
jgi:hypothetical protein